MRFFFSLQKELLQKDAVALSCCSETSEELLGAPLAGGAGQGHAGGSGRVWCCAGQGQPLCLHLPCAAQPCPQPAGMAPTEVILGVNLGCSGCSLALL